MVAEIPQLDELTYQSAGSLLTRNVPVARPGDDVATVQHMLDGHRYDIASHIAVCDSGNLLRGIARIEDVIAADGGTSIASVMDADPPSVAPGVDQEVAAWKAVQHGESALAVVDRDGMFRGMLPPAQLLRVLLHEHDEDMARMGGVLRQSTQARDASEEPLARRLWHRLPWLLIGLAGAVFAASIVGLFEADLNEHVLIAFFMPGIVYLADAVGTQTETLVIRGLSVGVGIRRIAVRELMTGVLAGLILGAVFFPLALVIWGEADVALSVSLALIAACSMATVVAMALPWAFEKAGWDPAFGSGPLATVCQDLLSILVYLSIASVLVS